MRKIKYAILTLVLAMAGIQFIPVSRNNGEEYPSTDFTVVYRSAKRISGIFKTSCYNCHSNHTDYPWYAYIQPVSLYLQSHIKEGKKNLNLSEFGYYPDSRKVNKLMSMINEIDEGNMPLPAYTLIHHNSKLSTEDKKLVTDYLELLKTVYELFDK